MGLDDRARAVLGDLAVARTRPGRDLPHALGSGAAELHGELARVGAVLGRCFLDGAAGRALAAEVAAGAGGGVAVRVAVEVPDGGLAGLPWETLVLPGQVVPLVLQNGVEMYRVATVEHAPSVIQVRGPLRILAVIARPGAGGGGLLDYEAELSAVIGAVNPARRDQDAFVEVLNWGSLDEIRSALLAHRYHVLHLSCHAAPGVLVLEDAAGKADEVSASRFAAEGLPAGRGVPLVVLAGCSTAVAPVAGSAGPDTRNADLEQEKGSANSEAVAVQAAEALQGVARELLGRGVPAVVAMAAPVTDRYATVFAAEVYKQLAAREDPVPLAAVSDARRKLETARQQLPADDPWASAAEWATPVLMQAGPPVALFRRADGTEPLGVTPAPVFDPAMVVRRIGQFVGRRSELRDLLAVMRGSGAGVVVHGIGGVGKSTLAVQLIEQLGDRRGLVVAVSAAASLSVDLVLEAMRVRLLAHATEQGLGDRDPLRQAVTALMDTGLSWRDRLEVVRQVVLPRLSMLLAVDNAEDLLTSDADGRELADNDLAEFLAAWVRAAPQARLVVTSRYPFTLPRGLQRRLRWHHLGPLSLAETRKLIWRLPGLDALTASDQERAYAMVGGHPRTLEYLDALLRGGEATFPDVADRLQAALDRRGVGDPQQWLAGVKGDLDQALAETIALAADDVLLDRLLAILRDAPPAAELLRRLAVYRRPVDEVAAAWQLSALNAVPDPAADLADRIEQVKKALGQTRVAGIADSTGELGLPPDVLVQYRENLAELARPPVSLSAGAHQALALLSGLGLAVPAAALAVGEENGTPGLFVHRWTAAALEARTNAAELADAHRKAAAYWRWRVAVWPQPRVQAVEDLLEARFHHHAAGDLDAALDINRQACQQLEIWGAWTTAIRLQEEARAWAPPQSRHAARILADLGTLAADQGNYDTAQEHYQESLAIWQEIGDRAGTAASYEQLGKLASRRGDYATAEEHYRAALTVFEETGDRCMIASSYHHLGILAENRGNYRTAQEYYQESLAIWQEIGDRAGTAASYSQLGSLAERRGDYATAEELTRAALTVFRETGSRARTAFAQQQLGLIAESREDYDTAEQYYQASLAIKQEIGDRAGAGTTYGQLGSLAERRGDYDTAEERYGKALKLSEQTGDRAMTAVVYHQLGLIAQSREDYDTAEQYYKESLVIDKENDDPLSAAGTLSQLGILCTERGRFADAVSYQLWALGIRAERSSPDCDTDVRMLSRQRAALGDQEFQRILHTLTAPYGVDTIMRITDQFR